MAPTIYTCTLVDTLPNPDEHHHHHHHHHANLDTPTLSMANTARSAPSPSLSTSPEPSAHSSSSSSSSSSSTASAATVSVERLVLDICRRERRGMAMQILAKVMKGHEDVALAIWHSRSTMAALIQEIVSIYRYLSPPRLSLADSTRVCDALALLKCVASHRETRTPFLQAGIPLYLYPFLNTSSVEKPIEYVRLTTLGVIGALVKYDDAVAINFLIQTELLPLCLRAMEMGTQLSKTVATLIVQKVLMDEVGLQHVCSTVERFYSVCDVLAFMVTSRIQPPSTRLLKYIILCYRRLSDNLRASFFLNDRLPKELRDGEFIECLLDDPETMSCLRQLLQNMAAAVFQAHKQGGVNYTIRSQR